MRAFHICSEDDVEEIWGNGLEPSSESAEWVVKRRELHRKMDEVGEKIHSNWVPRENALFFWSSYKTAMRYSEKKPYPALVEVDLSEFKVWQIPNDSIEEVFEYYIENGDTSDLDDKIEQVVRMASKWRGEVGDGVELWCQGNISSENIIKIIGMDGEPFELD